MKYQTIPTQIHSLVFKKVQKFSKTEKESSYHNIKMSSKT